MTVGRAGRHHGRLLSRLARRLHHAHRRHHPCLPAIVFALLLVSIAGPKLWLVVVAVAATHAPQVARVMRAAALDICEKDFVKAIELIRVPSRKIIRGEILPNLVTPLMVETGLRMTWSIVIIAGLSFIGFGLQPPAPNWGLMLNENRIGLVSNPWSVIVPALLIALLDDRHQHVHRRRGARLHRRGAPRRRGGAPRGAPPRAAAGRSAD